MAARHRTRFSALVYLLVTLTLGACEHAKSSNPLSPTIAGPIPGVEITQPVLLEPGQGWKFRDREQPITLLVENASTTGVRPLVYAFEIAVDSGFQNIVLSRRDVPPGDNGRTALRLQDKLQLGRTYYWRAWAYDGANTGAIASSVSFDVYPPVVINPPQPLSPASGETVNTLSPQLRVRNAARSGPAGNVGYVYQVARDQAFGQIVASTLLQPEDVTRGETIWAPAPLGFGQTYYWRAQATDGEVTSGWSPTLSFRTASAPPPSPSPGPSGPSCATATEPFDIVSCRRAQFGTLVSPAEAPGLLRGIASDLNAKRATPYYGMLRKTTGNNCGGYSCDIICASDGNHWDVLIAGPDAGENFSGPSGAAWNHVGFVDPARCEIIR